jgi:hypothetical protein
MLAETYLLVNSILQVAILKKFTKIYKCPVIYGHLGPLPVILKLLGHFYIAVVHIQSASGIP